MSPDEEQQLLDFLLIAGFHGTGAVAAFGSAGHFVPPVIGMLLLESDPGDGSEPVLLEDGTPILLEG